MHNASKKKGAILGKSEPFVREGLARGLLPFRTGFSMNGKRRSFVISRKLFEEYVGGSDEKIIDADYGNHIV